jgi:DNA-binding NarL/FixJ family response regulator
MPEVETSPSIRILIVDDHAMLREGVAAIIQTQPDMLVAGEAGNGAEALERYRHSRPDITLMDLQMPIVGGVEAIRAIRGEYPHARIIVLTTYAGDAQAVRALKAGAVGYMLKTSLRKEMLETIRAVHRGARRVPTDIAVEIAVHAGDEPLTDRETSVLLLASAGQGNKQIAWKLSISEDTVKSHMKSIFLKLNANDRAHAVTIAARRGIIEI